jgi:8-oxo-dGTP pyrophosphatase MutT (NUDIX family)
MRRVETSSAFPSAHVFPGGLLSEQDGPTAGALDPLRHRDSSAYRLGAIRECFEETGILLARSHKSVDQLLLIEEHEKQLSRLAIHSGTVRFHDWLARQGGQADTGGLIPFSRWITPIHLQKRFTTQMYIYMLPMEQPLASRYAVKENQNVAMVPTTDGGLENTAVEFAPVERWLERARSNEIVLFPPQVYLLQLLAPLLNDCGASNSNLQRQRVAVMRFLSTSVDASGTTWNDLCICPKAATKLIDGRMLLDLKSPGPELEGHGRSGDHSRVILAMFTKEGPRNVEVRSSNQKDRYTGKL